MWATGEPGRVFLDTGEDIKGWWRCKDRCSSRFDRVPREWRKGEGGREGGEDLENSLPQD